jgi:hypothetical protein
LSLPATPQAQPASPSRPFVTCTGLTCPKSTTNLLEPVVLKLSTTPLGIFYSSTTSTLTGPLAPAPAPALPPPPRPRHESFGTASSFVPVCLDSTPHPPAFRQISGINTRRICCLRSSKVQGLPLESFFLLETSLAPRGIASLTVPSFSPRFRVASSSGQPNNKEVCAIPSGKSPA